MPSNPDFPRFLLIDDDPGFAAILKQAAQGAGFVLESVESLEKVGKIAELDGFDAVLVDYDLEKGTGIQVAEFLVATRPRLPVILVSSTNRPLQDARAQLPNVLGFVSKWRNPREFIGEFLTIWRKNRRLSAAA